MHAHPFIFVIYLFSFSSCIAQNGNLYLLFQEVNSKSHNERSVNNGVVMMENFYKYYKRPIYCGVSLEFTTIYRDSTITVPLSELWQKYPVQTMDKLAVILKSMELPKPPPAEPPKSGEIIKFSPSKGEPYFDEGCIRQSNYMSSFKNIYIVEIDHQKQVGILTRVRISNKFE